MSEKNKVIVNIASNEYTLSGEESPEYIQRVASLVDKKTREIMKAAPSLSKVETAVLASINMGDEAMRQHHIAETQLRKVREMEKRLEASIVESDAFRQEIQAARDNLTRMKQELIRSEAENRELRQKMHQTKNGGEFHE